MLGFAISFFALLATCFVAWQAFGFCVAWRLLFSDHHNHAKTQTPTDRNIDSVTLSIPTADGHHIAAWMLTPKPHRSLGGACIVMVHGFDSGKDKLWEFPQDGDYRATALDQGGESLWEAGFVVVAIDLRNHGESSDNGPVTLGARESDDVLATIGFLHDHASRLGIDPTRIGLRGESMGGATCLIAAAKDREDRVSALWSDSVYADAATAMIDFMRYKNVPAIFAPPARGWLVRLTGVDLSEASPIQHIGQIGCPVHLVHSDGDSMLPMRHFDALAQSDLWEHPPETMVVSGHQHNRLWREPGYIEKQVDFFKRHLAAESSQRRAA